MALAQGEVLMAGIRDFFCVGRSSKFEVRRSKVEGRRSNVECFVGIKKSLFYYMNKDLITGLAIAGGVTAAYYFVLNIQENSDPKLILNAEAPAIQVKGIWYINLDESTERDKAFLENFHRYNVDIPLHRFSAIKPATCNKSVKKGALGCSLSHIGVLDIISVAEPGWYLVCEDDAIGDFNLIGSNIYIRNIILTHPEKKIINLYTQEMDKINNTYDLYNRDYNLKIMGINMSSYIVTPEGARLARDIIRKNLDKNHAIMPLCDETRVATLARPGNGIGAYVKLLSISGLASDIDRLGR